MLPVIALDYLFIMQIYKIHSKSMNLDDFLLLLQRLSRVGTHEAEGLNGDGGESHQQDDGKGCGVDGRGVPDADGICLEPSAEIGVR